MTVSGNLVVDGNATLLLDGTTGTVATTFGGVLRRTSPGTLVVVPVTGNLNTSEAVLFASNPEIGSWAVVQASGGTNTSGDYLTTTATKIGGTTYYQLTTAGTADSTPISPSQAAAFWRTSPWRFRPPAALPSPQ